MTELRHDPTVRLPDEVPAPPRIGMLEGGPTLAGAADARSFLVEGGAVALSGPERGGIEVVAIGGRVVVSDVEVDIGPAVNVVAAPGLMRREHFGRRGSVVETLLAPSTLPLAAVQWVSPTSRPDGDGEPIEVGFTLEPNATEVRYHSGPTGLSLVDDMHPDRVTAVVLHPPPSAWVVSEAPTGGVRMRASVAHHDLVTALVASGPPARVGIALRAGAHLQAQERGVHDDTARRGLSVRSGVAELDDGITWAQARLAGSLTRAGPGPVAPDRVFWSALGALAVGDAESASRALDYLGDPEGGRDDEDANANAEPSVLPSGPLASLIAARMTLTLGDPTPALRYAGMLDATHLERLHRRSDAGAWALWSLALEVLADALRHSASETEIRRIRHAAALPPPASRPRRRLPMAGAPDPEARPASLLRLLLRRGEAGAPVDVGPIDRPSLEAWTLLARGEVGPGYSLWRSVLASGLGRGSGPRGSWEGAETVAHPGAPVAGTLLGAFAHGLLGYFPDAPSGRVELFPALPEHFKSFDVDGITLADSRFDIRYRRSGSCTTWTITPARGRVPANLVLAPTLPDTRVEAVRLDGAPVDLDWEPRQSGVRIRVQMPLDQERVLQVETR